MNARVSATPLRAEVASAAAVALLTKAVELQAQSRYLTACNAAAEAFKVVGGRGGDLREAWTWIERDLWQTRGDAARQALEQALACARATQALRAIAHTVLLSDEELQLVTDALSDLIPDLTGVRLGDARSIATALRDRLEAMRGGA